MPEFTPDLPAALSTARVQRMPAGGMQTDTLAAEVPVALVFNGISHAVMLATPRDLEAFALGFALSEGILDTVDQCFGLEVLPVQLDGCAALEVQLDIAAPCFARLKAQRRSLAGRTGCGVCGLDSLQALDLVPPPLRPQPWVQAMDTDTVLRAVQAMVPLQLLNATCGSLHAAAWATPDGEVTLLMEDVGRHNALDKLLGALHRAGLPSGEGFIVVTSRASYEMVQKTASAGVGLLAAVSAVTGLAIDTARGCGLTLLGFARGADLCVYSHPQRISLEGKST